MKEINANKEAWSLLSEDHYNTYRKLLLEGRYILNVHIERELGSIEGKELIHLQCNTGADSMVLARKGAHVTGVDLVPDNIFYARKLASDLNIGDIRFIESDIMKLSDIHQDTYDVVFTSEGVLGWLPDLNIWAHTIRKLLRDDGFLYVYDSHPFFLAMDEEKLRRAEYDIKYPYFGKSPDADDYIGGYASERKYGVTNYFWMHTVSDIINALASAGLHIEFFNEFPDNFFDSGDMVADPENELFYYEYNRDKYPMSFSLKATISHN